MKHIETLIQDIYKVVATKEVDEEIDVEAEIEKFGENVKTLMRTEFGRNRKRDTRKLRLSSIGREDKFIWNQFHGTLAEKIMPHTFVKFMYGHLIEEMILFLARVAGHTVTDEQKECDVEGVKGHMDCRIDGVVTDVKSASSYGFKKFKYGTVSENDDFGYVDQLRAYAHSEGEKEFGWLAMDKQNGHLTYLKQNMDDFEGDIAERVRHVKKLVEQPEPLEYCFQPVPDGKSGNLKLAMGCSYCQFKRHCYTDLRAFKYSQGIKFLSKVVNEPKVEEIPLHEI